MTALAELGVKRFFLKPIRAKDLVVEVEAALTDPVTSHTSSDESIPTARLTASELREKVYQLDANLEAEVAETRKLRQRLAASDLELNELRAAKQRQDIGSV